MARKPSKPEKPSTPAEGLRRTSAPNVGKSYRVKSASEIADLLGVNRNTVAKWIRDGMPTEGEPPAAGKPYMIDMAAAVRWLQERAAREAAEAMPTSPIMGTAPDGGESFEQAKTRKERALANAAESDAAIKALNEAERRGAVGPYETLLDMVRVEYGRLSAKLSEVGPAVEAALKNGTPERIGREVDRRIRKALAENLKGDLDEVTGEPADEGA